MNDILNFEVNNNLTYFNFIKNRTNNNKLMYPELRVISIENNYLIYKNKKVSLENIYLAEFNLDIFNLKAELFFFIINTLSELKNNFDNVCKKINYAKYLVQQNTLTIEQSEYLEKFDYEFELLLSSKNTFYSEAIIELTTAINYVYELAYDDSLSNAEGANYLKKLEIKRTNTDNFSTNIAQKTRKRTTISNHYSNSSSSNEANDFLVQTAAFMNASFIISITLMLGIVIAIIFFSIAVS